MYIASHMLMHCIIICLPQWQVAKVNQVAPGYQGCQGRRASQVFQEEVAGIEVEVHSFKIHGK